MKIRIEINESDIIKLVAAAMSDKTGQEIAPEHIDIEVKSKQNYKSEWEVAAFRAVYVKNE